MGDLRISTPQILGRTFFYGLASLIQDGRARVTAIPAATSTRVFSCRTCAEAFCTYEHHVGSVFDLKGEPFLNWYHVRQAANTRMTEGEESVCHANLGNGMTVIFNDVRCTGCDHHVGYRVLNVGAPDEETDEIRVGEYILIASLSSEIPA